MTLQSINPATGELLRSVPAFGEEELRSRLAMAAAAFPVQRDTPPEHRARCLRKLSHLLRDETDELARLISLETGKVLAAAVAEVERCAAACRYYADNAPRLLAPELLQSELGQAYVQWSPLGVVLGVLPWQSPFWKALRFAVPALLAGNAVLLKHAATVPQCSLALERLVRQAGFPRGAFTALLIEDGMVEQVLNHPAVQAVTVSGTLSEGRALAAQAGWLTRRCTLDLACSQPIVVMPSADLEAAADAAAEAVAENEGGACRIVLHGEIALAFQQQLASRLEGLRVGDPLKEGTQVGPLGTLAGWRALEEGVASAVAAGGRVLTGGTRMVGNGFFFEPTLLSDVPTHAPVAADAMEGPVAWLFRARNVDEALTLANTPHAARAGSVWTREPAEQQRLLDGLLCGTVALNALPREDAQLPAGAGHGYGHGRELGLPGLREWMHARNVILRRSSATQG